MATRDEIVLSREEVKVLEAASCNFYGNLPTNRQENIIRHLEHLDLVRHNYSNYLIQWTLTSKGMRELHKSKARIEDRKISYRHDWSIAAFTFAGTIIGALIAVIFSYIH